MTTRMLIDARHPEETRVAVLTGNRIEEFDFESADHRQIKGNIYLAKVTRVEPSLQAAFVDFGGNRHGFLAFSEIHPDYYQIPKQDREALLAEEAAHAEEEAALRAAEEAEDDAAVEAGLDPMLAEDDGGGEALADELAGEDGVREVDTSEKDEVATIEGGHVSDGDEPDEEPGEGADEDARADADDEIHAAEAIDEGDRGQRRGRGRRQGRALAQGTRGQADALRDKRMALRRRYKIQDVIQRRQVLLVQVVKEERGNKGAALTTYLSLAGRYCVLMPNSSHGGGISRKISSAADRKRLKSIVAEMSLPKSMGCIVRTAGLSRTKPEIKRDFDYLAQLWDEIRERTLRSSAPAAIHSDSDLIKRAIRDIYNRDVEEVVVEGEAGFRAARDFMRLLMPSHARRVKQYADALPLFQRYGAEDQLTAMYDPVVQLRSGGYLVINPTEALVSIDINSGRSTKEHGIEATALNTNLEAAREIARQLRLRDMAGLIVIDFIDMEYGANVRKVEKCMKDALKNDRARIQIGRISGFGLMEMSRQRLRTGVLEATTRSCPHCDGTGLVRTASSAGLSGLRLIEDEAAKGRGSLISLFASQEAAIYLLNAKRADLAEIERRYGVSVEVLPEGESEGAKMRAASSGPRPESVPRYEPVAEPEADDLADEEEDFSEDQDDEEADGDRRAEAPAKGEPRDGRGRADEAHGSDEHGERKRRKRRRGGRGRERGKEAGQAGVDDAEDNLPEEDGADGADVSTPGENDNEAGDEASPGRRRRSRRRRGDRLREDATAEDGADKGSDTANGGSAIAATDGNAPERVAGAADGGDRQPDGDVHIETQPDADEQPGEGEVIAQPDEPGDPVPQPRGRRRKAEAAVPEGEGDEKAKPVRRSRRKSEPADDPAAPATPADAGEAPKPRSRRRKPEPTEPPVADGPPAERPAAAGEQPAADVEAEPASPAPELADVDPAEPAAASAGPADAGAAEAQPEPARSELQSAGEEDEGQDVPTEGTPRRGWWQRTFGA